MTRPSRSTERQLMRIKEQTGHHRTPPRCDSATTQCLLRKGSLGLIGDLTSPLDLWRLGCDAERVLGVAEVVGVGGREEELDLQLQSLCDKIRPYCL